jgi:hypothetical protein
MANFFAFSLKKPICTHPTGFYFFGCHVKFRQKKHWLKTCTYIPIIKEVGVWNQEFFFSSLSQEESQIWLEVTRGSRKKELEPYFVLATSKNSLSKYVNLWPFFPSKYGNFCAFMHWTFLLARLQNFTQKITLLKQTNPNKGCVTLWPCHLH